MRASCPAPPGPSFSGLRPYWNTPCGSSRFSQRLPDCPLRSNVPQILRLSFFRSLLVPLSAPTVCLCRVDSWE
ncbi:hypothetical protein NN561_003503 [Cricetulus griseus]